MQRALCPYISAGVALAGASLIALTPTAPPLPGVRVAEAKLAATAIALPDAFSALTFALDPGSYSDSSFATPTDFLGQAATFFDQILSLLPAPIYTVADTLASDLVGLLDGGNASPSVDGDITLNSDFDGLVTHLDNDFSNLTSDLNSAVTNIINSFSTDLHGLDGDLSTTLVNGIVGDLTSVLNGDLTTTVGDQTWTVAEILAHSV